MNTRMNRAALNIGTYCLAPYARTEKHIREIAECGIDFLIGVNNDRNTLDLFAKYGVGAVVGGVVPGWWGGDGANAGGMSKAAPLEKYAAAAESFADHPAIWGIDTGDEPSALDFPHYGKVIEAVDRLFPRQFAYLNLYPNYASVAETNGEQRVNQLGAPSYAEHIARYCADVGTDYICYDFYMYSISVEKAYDNLRIVSDACLASGRSMWIVLQVNSNREEELISENMLRFQAYSALAFGAEVITWACYTAGWWYNNVLDLSGEKTVQYDKLRHVNAELHRFGREYMRYRRVSTHFVEGEGKFDSGVFSDVRACGGEKLIVGQMVARSVGGYALMICGADDTHDRGGHEYDVCFRADGYQPCAYTGDGEVIPEKQPDGSYKVRLRSCGGALITAKR